jgi:hypothetical protein
MISGALGIFPQHTPFLLLPGAFNLSNEKSRQIHRFFGNGVLAASARDYKKARQELARHTGLMEPEEFLRLACRGLVRGALEQAWKMKISLCINNDWYQETPKLFEFAKTIRGFYPTEELTVPGIDILISMEKDIKDISAQDLYSYGSSRSDVFKTIELMVGLFRNAGEVGEQWDEYVPKLAMFLRQVQGQWFGPKNREKGSQSLYDFVKASITMGILTSADVRNHARRGMVLKSIALKNPEFGILSDIRLNQSGVVVKLGNKKAAEKLVLKKILKCFVK